MWKEEEGMKYVFFRMKSIKEIKNEIFQKCMWQLNHYVSCLRCKKRMPLKRLKIHQWYDCYHREDLR